jgi:hypothetical protein
LGNRSFAFVHVGRVRIERDGAYGSGLGIDHVFRPIEEKLKLLILRRAKLWQIRSAARALAERHGEIVIESARQE